MPISSLPIATAIAQLALSAVALPQATAHQISLDREDALTALGTAVHAPEGGWVSLTIQQAAVSDRPISASCKVKSGRVASSNRAMRRQPRAIVCRFSEAGRWLPVRLELQSSAVRGMDSDGSNAMRGELSYGGLRFAVSPLATGFASGGATPNRYVFTMSESPAANVAIGEKSSVRVAKGVDGSGVRAILLAAAAMTVLSPPAGLGFRLQHRVGPGLRRLHAGAAVSVPHRASPSKPEQAWLGSSVTSQQAWMATSLAKKTPWNGSLPMMA